MSNTHQHDTTAQVERLLSAVTAHLPGGGELRPGQLQMAEAVWRTVGAGDAADSETVDETDSEKVDEADSETADETDDDVAPRTSSVLLVEAGTGTGKSLAYLVPPLDADLKTVVATATIALQGQLVDKDVPLVNEGLGRQLTAAVLKGRSNYLCQQQLNELVETKRSDQLSLLGGRNPDRLKPILAWASETETGDREELDDAPAADIWRAVSVSGDECPGATRCPSGGECYSERARQRAMAADVIVTNHHYYGLHLSSGGVLLPEHDVVIFDEAHQLPDTLSATCGVEFSGGRLRAAARRVRSMLTDEEASEPLDRSASELDSLLRPDAGNRIAVNAELQRIAASARQRCMSVMDTLRKLDASEGSNVAARIERLQRSLTRLVTDVDELLANQAGDDSSTESGESVLWVDGKPDAPVLRKTPLTYDRVLADTLWPERSVIMTSATLPDAFGAQLGLGAKAGTPMKVESPFDYETNAVLYCPVDLPSPRSPDYRRATQDEMVELITAAGGRTLGLFTSFSAMDAAAERLKDELDFPILVQGEASKAALVETFKADPSSVLLATMSFWQGIDLPGETLTLVTIDRIPFPRPDDPVTQARRDLAGAAAFRMVDLPRAQMLLAQAAGRLVRTTSDRGVVAVLDPRLATNKSYRWDLIGAMPPFTRTKDRSQVIKFLQELRT